MLQHYIILNAFSFRIKMKYNMDRISILKTALGIRDAYKTSIQLQKKSFLTFCDAITTDVAQ